MDARLKEFTFPDSGETVFVPPVSLAALSLKLQRRYPRPNPPIQEVDYGDGKKVKELNYLHPDYDLAVRAWNAYLEHQSMELGLSRIFAIKLNKEQLKAVQKWKKANPGLWEEGDDDTSLWFEEIAITTDDDLKSLVSFMTDGDPDPGGVEDTEESF